MERTLEIKLDMDVIFLPRNMDFPSQRLVGKMEISL